MVFELIGGKPALDFLNTMSGFRGTRPRELLQGYEDLVGWAKESGMVDARQAAELLREASLHPRKAQAALEEAIAVREALHDVLFAAVRGQAVPQKPLETVNRWIGAALGRWQLQPKTSGGFSLEFEEDGDFLSFLRPVAASAADVLGQGLPTGRVRICDLSHDEECGWFFYDTTRNRSRRWCSMGDCGNNAKQRRHTRRRKSV